MPWLEVISPQHLVLPQERRLSGVPASAEAVGPHQYRWLTWPRLPAQIASGERQGYVREVRSVDLSSVPVNRWVWDDGMATPVRASLGEDGSNHLLSPIFGIPDFDREGMGRDQHPVLERLLRAM